MPPAQNFFIFMQFSGKIGQIIGLHPLQGCRTPLWEILDPPLVTLSAYVLSQLGKSTLEPVARVEEKIFKTSTAQDCS